MDQDTLKLFDQNTCNNLIVKNVIIERYHFLFLLIKKRQFLVDLMVCLTPCTFLKLSIANKWGR